MERAQTLGKPSIEGIVRGPQTRCLSIKTTKYAKDLKQWFLKMEMLDSAILRSSLFTSQINSCRFIHAGSYATICFTSTSYSSMLQYKLGTLNVHFDFRSHRHNFARNGRVSG